MASEKNNGTDFNNQKVLNAVLKTAVNGIIIIDDKGVILSFNPAAGQAFGYKSEEVIGKNVKMLMPKVYAKNHDGYISRYKKTLKGKIIGTGRELVAIKKDGTKFPIWLSVSTAKVQGKFVFAGIIEDITEKKEAAEKLNFLSQHDSITELLNYYAFTKVISETLKKEKGGVLLLIKINNFSELQNVNGIWISNKLLKELSIKLVGCLRSSDDIIRKTRGDLLSYLGNATFAVLLSNLSPVKEKTELIATRINQTLSGSFNIENQIIFPHVSIGISEPYTGTDFSEIFKSADIALSLAIQKRDSFFAHFSKEYQVQFNRIALIAKTIYSAIAQDEFYLVYQPKINVKTKQISGMEVLIRWRSLSLGNVRPDEFIPVAIREGLMAEIDKKTFEKSCAQLARWKKLGFIKNCSLSINVLPEQLLKSGFVKMVKDVINSNGLNPHDVEFEFLESNLMGDINAVIPALKELNEFGIALAIDDFGTGHSSLSRLSLLPIKILKVDRSFVLGIGTHEPEAIIKIILQLAKLLKLKVIAEGVENKKQLNFLTKLGCHIIQGYYYSKPLVAKEMTQCLGSSKCFKGLDD